MQILRRLSQIIFEFLSSDDFLKMYLQWKRENPDEAINKSNGTKFTKRVSLHKNVLDMDVNAAVNQFNYACFAIVVENGQIIPYELVFTANSINDSRNFDSSD